MSSTIIRPISLGIILRDDHLLCFDGTDNSKHFYRPLGGGIEHGELAEEALIREFEEELSAEVVPIRQLGVLENIFTYAGKPKHELAFMFEARFKDESFYLPDQMKIIEGDSILWTHWVPIEKVFNKEVILYPDGLPELLAKEYTNLEKFSFNH